MHPNMHHHHRHHRQHQHSYDEEDQQLQSSLPAPHRAAYRPEPSSLAPSFTSVSSPPPSLPAWKRNDVPEIHHDDDDNVHHARRHQLVTATFDNNSAGKIDSKKNEAAKQRVGRRIDQKTPAKTLQQQFNEQETLDNYNSRLLMDDIEVQKQEDILLQVKKQAGNVRKKKNKHAHRVVVQSGAAADGGGGGGDRNVTASSSRSSTASTAVSPCVVAVAGATLLEPTLEKQPQLKHDNDDDDTGTVVVVAKPFDEEDIRSSLRRKMIQLAVPADIVDLDAPTDNNNNNNNEDDDDDDNNVQLQLQKQIIQRRRRRLLYAFSFLAVVIIVVVIVVVVVVVNNSSSTTSTTPFVATPTWSPSMAPTILVPTNGSQHPTAPPQYAPTDLNTVNAQEYMFTKLQGGVNHTLMTAYLQQDAVQLASYVEDADQRLTLFAPTDASWRRFANNNASTAFAYYVNISSNNHHVDHAWSGHLKLLLQYHIVARDYVAATLFEQASLTTVAGLQLSTNPSDHTVGDDFATLVTVDIQCANGYIHIPDRVLIPPPLDKTILEWITNTTQTQLQTLSNILSSTTSSTSTTLSQSNDDQLLLLSSLQQTVATGTTLLAPTDAAFASINNWTTLVYNTTLGLVGNSTLTRHRGSFLWYHLLNVNLNAVPASSLTLLTTGSGYSLWWTLNDRNASFCNGVAVGHIDCVQNGVVALVNQVLIPPNMQDLLEITTNVTASKYNFTTFLQANRALRQQRQQQQLFGGEVNLLTDESNDHLTLLAPLEDAFANNNISFADRLFYNEGTMVLWSKHLQSVIRHHFTTQTIPSTVAEPGRYDITMLSGYNTSVVVQSDGTFMVNDNISTEPIANGPLRATNGVIYVLKGLLLPDWVNRSITQTVIGFNPELSKLASLLIAAASSSNLSSVLNGIGPLTFLAPSNDALINTSSLLLGSSSSSSSRSLETFLLGHILHGNWYLSTTLANASTTTIVTALNNQSWRVQKVNNHTFVGGALITTANILASNGVIHVIDRMLKV